MKAIAERVERAGQPFFLLKRRNDPKFDFLWHFHPEYELTLIVRSSGKRFVGDHIADYSDGDLILIGPNLPHTWHSETDAQRRKRHQAIVIQFAESFIVKSLIEEAEMEEVKRLLQRSRQGLQFFGHTGKLVSEKMLKLDELSGLSKLIEFLSIVNILAHSDEFQMLSSNEFLPSLPHAEERRIDRVCHFINQHFTESITQPEAAAIARMSVPAFSRFFKTMMGRTFTDYLNHLRIGHACKLMIETDHSITEIAYKSGFNNLSNFNRRFINLKKISPREYRRRFL